MHLFSRAFGECTWDHADWGLCARNLRMRLMRGACLTGSIELVTIIQAGCGTADVAPPAAPGTSGAGGSNERGGQGGSSSATTTGGSGIAEGTGGTDAPAGAGGSA